MTAAVVVVSLITGAVAQALATRIANTRPLFGVLWHGAWAIVCAALFGLDVATRDWGWVPVMAFGAMLNAWHCWRYWNRRKRKRAPALAGAKSRARVAALVRKVRETARPRKVLRPVPGRSL